MQVLCCVRDLKAGQNGETYGLCMSTFLNVKYRMKNEIMCIVVRHAVIVVIHPSFEGHFYPSDVDKSWKVESILTSANTYVLL